MNYLGDAQSFAGCHYYCFEIKDRGEETKQWNANLECPIRDA